MCVNCDSDSIFNEPSADLFYIITLIASKQTIQSHFFCIQFSVLPTNNQVTVENVVVVESGDDSDDEWDYIQVNKDKAEQQEQQQQAQDIESAELVSAKGDQIETTQQFEEVAAAVSSAPLELLLGEEPQIAHAVAQAFAEPEEACTEVNNCNNFCRFFFN